MSSSITWTKPLSNETWTHTKIERSATQTGTYAEIGSVLIAISNYFDIDGTSTSWYKIRFYDSAALIYSEYSDAIQGVSTATLTGQATNDILLRTITGVNILGALGAIGPDSNGNYTLFGMSLHQNTAEMIVSQCYDYTTELIGEDAITDTTPSIIRRVRGFVSNYSALRILAILAGVSITKHFNYTSGGLNVQKPAVSQMRAMLEHYAWETRRWQKLLLTRAVVETQDDLNLYIINEEAPIGSGITFISYDFGGI
jgi:hypothetical protein